MLFKDASSAQAIDEVFYVSGRATSNATENLDGAASLSEAKDNYG